MVFIYSQKLVLHTKQEKLIEVSDFFLLRKILSSTYLISYNINYLETYRYLHTIPCNVFILMHKSQLFLFDDFYFHSKKVRLYLVN